MRVIVFCIKKENYGAIYYSDIRLFQGIYRKSFRKKKKYTLPRAKNKTTPRTKNPSEYEIAITPAIEKEIITWIIFSI